jgi:hypothetical protein
MAVSEFTNLKIEKGTDFEATFNIFNEDESEFDITSNFVGVSKLRKYSTSPTSYPFEVTLNDVENNVTISMASTMTSALPSGRCVFDILLTYGYADTTTKKFVQGTIIVEDTASL